MFPALRRFAVFERGVCEHRNVGIRSLGVFLNPVTPLSPNDGLGFSYYDCSSSANPQHIDSELEAAEGQRRGRKVGRVCVWGYSNTEEIVP